MRMLVFGATGQLATELARQRLPSGTQADFISRAEADLAEPATLASVVAAHRPDIVAIAAAYTAVDRAESEEDLATRVNADGPAAIAAAAARLGAPVIHISTDYVFDGRKGDWYFENDVPSPAGAYGRSKLAGEIRVAAANPRHLILRTSWVYSPFGSNFVRTMLRLAAERDVVRVVGDQYGCPTAAGDLAAAVLRLAPLMLESGAPAGVYHLAGGGATSWHGLAEAIFSGLAARGMRRPGNEVITTADYPTPAVRPMDSRLASGRMAHDFDIALPHWEESLQLVLDELLNGAAAARGHA